MRANGRMWILVATGAAVLWGPDSSAQQASDAAILGGPYEYEVDGRTYHTITRQLKVSEYPMFADDYDLRGLKLAVERQLRRFASVDLTGKIVMGGKTYPLRKAQESLQVFNGLIDTFNACVARQAKDRCYQDFNRSIRSKFNVFAPELNSKDPRFGEEKFARFTGYVTHHVEGRMKKEGDFIHPIYAFPNNARLNGKTREEIDFGRALAGRGLELVYVKNRFDIYMMHVEGSGKITVMDKDATTRDFYLQFETTNKQRWEFISLYMAKQGYIDNPSIASQRKFLRLHPEKEREIFRQCPSYVYLKPTANMPKGSGGVPVTDGRTIAQDNATYPFKGLLAYIEAARPAETGNYDMEEEEKANVQFIPFSRFMLDQDTGGAINGKARADIYFGSDDYGMFASQYQDELGKIHYLLLK